MNSYHDLTDPAEGAQASQLVINRAVAALARLWGCQVRMRQWATTHTAMIYHRGEAMLGDEPVGRPAAGTEHVITLPPH